MKYKVTLTETLEKEVFVEADSYEDAYNQAVCNYNSADDDYVLTDSDYKGVEYKVEPATKAEEIGHNFGMSEDDDFMTALRDSCGEDYLYE